MERPDKESCAATHLEANGFAACQIVEVEGGMYDLFIGENQKMDHGLVRHEDGKVDNGYRYILTLDIIAKTRSTNSIDFDQLKFPKGPIKIAKHLISEFDGKEVRSEGYDSIIAVFKIPENALRCAHKIQDEFLKYRNERSPDPHTLGGSYINFMMEEGQDRVEKSYGDNYKRLQKVKTKYDPNNFFHVNQNIKPG